MQPKRAFLDDPNLQRDLQEVRLVPLILGLSFCYVTVSGVFTFSYGPSAALINFLLVIALSIALTELVGRHPSGRWIYLIAVGTVVSATFIGCWNYRENYSLFHYAVMGRTYKDVDAASPAAAYLDAGRIRFNNVSIDYDSGVGFKEYTSTFCVAPILGKANQQTVNFWAVGRDCCDEHGGFKCDDSEEQGVSGGLAIPYVGTVGYDESSKDDDDGVSSLAFAPLFALVALFLTFCLASYLTFFLSFFFALVIAFGLCIVLPEVFAVRAQVSATSQDAYIRAIIASSALAERQYAMPPVLVRWVAEPNLLLALWHFRAMTAWLVPAGAHFLLVGVACVLIDKYYKGKIAEAVSKKERMKGGGNYGTVGAGQATRGPGGTFRDPFLLGGGNPMAP